MKENLRNKLTVHIAKGIRRQLTKGAIVSSFVAFVALISFFAACTNQDAAHEHDTYTCPMHPTVISDRPGTCPVCGMDLVRKARPGEAVKITEELAKLIKSPNEAVVASVKTIRGEYKSVPATVSAQGVVTYDTRNIYTIPARVGGRLEKVFLKYAFERVSKGQKIAEIYSPELITAQRELVFLLENDPENKFLIDAAKTKLELLGMTRNQINKLAQKKEATNTISVYSPYSGYLITGQQTPSTSVAMLSTQSAGGGMGDGMGAAPASGPATAQQPPPNNNLNGLIPREGDYVTAGETLFTVVNANALRIELNLPSNFTGTLKEGSKVKLNLGNDQTEVATVDFIQPFFSEGQEFIKIRVYTNETAGLQVGQLVNAEISLGPQESLWVPTEAVLDLGLQKVVFKKDRGVLKPTEVTTGVTAEGMVEIKSGLASTEEIAANAQFLVDSQSFIKPVK